jgi:hypothetical protein
LACRPVAIRQAAPLRPAPPVAASSAMPDTSTSAASTRPPSTIVERLCAVFPVL